MRTLLCMLVLGALLGLSTQAAAIPPGDAEAGESKAEPCMACHAPGLDNPAFPRISGQHADYLYYSLRAYASGDRQDPVMSGQVSGLSDRDMADLASYFSTLDGELSTVSR